MVKGHTTRAQSGRSGEDARTITRRQNNAFPDAFTLIELLVVLAVVAILAALLLPVLHRAKQSARMINCISNQKQLAMVWILYAHDNNDKLVANGIPIRVPTRNIKWVQGAFVFAEDSTNSDWILNSNWALFARYMGTVANYVCPGDPPTVSYLGSSYPRVRSYSLNNYLGWEGPPDGNLRQDNWQVFQKSNQIERPAEIFLLQDVNQKSICWPYFGTYMDRESFFNFPSSVHGRRGTVSFTDGHVQAHRWKDPRTVEAKSSNYHAHDDASLRNVDIGWLQRHATHPK